MFSPGDIVVYRHHVCKVAGIREAYFEGNDYLELHTVFEKSLRLYVALSEAHAPTLRSVMTKREALALIDSIAETDAIDESALKAEGLLCDELSISLGIERDNVKDFLIERVKKAEARKR